MNDQLLQQIDNLLTRRFEVFEDKFDRKLDAQTERFDRKLDEQTERFDRKFEEQAERFDRKLEEQAERFDRELEQGLRDQDARFDQKLELGLRDQDARFDAKLDGKVDELRRQTGVLLDSMHHKIDLVIEGQQGLAERMDRFELRLESVEQQVIQQSGQIQGLAAELSAHRHDTEAHGHYMVRE